MNRCFLEREAVAVDRRAIWRRVIDNVPFRGRFIERSDQRARSSKPGDGEERGAPTSPGRASERASRGSAAGRRSAADGSKALGPPVKLDPSVSIKGIYIHMLARWAFSLVGAFFGH